MYNKVWVFKLQYELKKQLLKLIQLTIKKTVKTIPQRYYSKQLAISK